jgi:hypothetical protein
MATSRRTDRERSGGDGDAGWERARYDGTVSIDPHSEARRTGGGGRAFWWRLSDNLFRRLPWFLVPILLVGALGVAQAANTTALYRSGATLSVSTNPLLPDQVVGGADAQMFESLGAATSRIIAERLGTDAFMDAVARAAGLGDALDTGLVTLDVIRENVWTTSRGSSLVSVNATWADAQTSYQLVVATVSQYQQFLTDTVASAAAEAEDFWKARLTTLEDERDRADEALDRFLSQLPGEGNDEEYPVSITVEISRLSSKLESVEEEIRTVEDQIDTAVLTRTQQTTAAGRSFSIVDQPRVPSAPDSTLVKQGMLVVSFVMLGAVIAIAALLLTTAIDQTVASSFELAAIPGVAQVATVPKWETKRRGRRLRGRRRRPAPVSVAGIR